MGWPHIEGGLLVVNPPYYPKRYSTLLAYYPWPYAKTIEDPLSILFGIVAVRECLDVMLDSVGAEFRRNHP